MPLPDDEPAALPGRPLFLERLRHGILRAARRGRRLAVLALAVDGVDDIRATRGQEFVERLLQEVAERLNTCLRGGDTVTALGEGDFILALEDLREAEDAALVAGNLLEVISLPQEIFGHLLQVRGEIGISLYPDDGDDAAVLAIHARAALEGGRLEGASGFRFYHPAMAARAARRRELEAALGRVLEKGESEGELNDALELHYQPIVDLASGRTERVEALVRWRRPDGFLVPPEEFLAVAESAGLIGAVDDWVLAAACRQLAAWQGRGVGLQVAVNVWPGRLMLESFSSRVAARVRESGVEPGRLRIEVDEPALMAAPGAMLESLQRLGEEGFAVILDGFGTGCADWSQLGGLPVDGVKIAPGRVALAGNEEGRRTLRSLLGAAGALGLELGAGGIEAPEQAAFLQSCGCTAGQGFLFAAPEKAEILEAWLSARHPRKE